MPDVDDTEAYRTAIEEHGFALRFVEPGHRYFRPRPGVARLWQLHVCQAGFDWERVHLLFRDFLRANSAEAAAYASLEARRRGAAPRRPHCLQRRQDAWISGALARRALGRRDRLAALAAAAAEVDARLSRRC